MNIKLSYRTESGSHVIMKELEVANFSGDLTTAVDELFMVLKSGSRKSWAIPKVEERPTP